MSKLKNKMLSIACSSIIVAGTISSVSAVTHTQTKDVSGGSITASVSGTSGSYGWSCKVGGSLNLNTSIGSKGGGATLISFSETIWAASVSAQLYKVDYNYVTIKLGQAAFLFNK